MYTAVKRWFNYLLDFIYPELCNVCSCALIADETVLCTKCQLNLPYSNLHLVRDNLIEKRFGGKIPLIRAAACFPYDKGGAVQQLLYNLKYKGAEEVGRKLGRLYAYRLLTSPDFQNIDVIIPVPLHKTKQRKRGYNQSECFAKGLAEVLNIPVNTQHLIKTAKNESQTRKSRFERAENVKTVYTLHSAADLTNKHILLVDDVITTGATIEACVQCLLQAENCTVSVAAIAYAK